MKAILTALNYSKSGFKLALFSKISSFNCSCASSASLFLKAPPVLINSKKLFCSVNDDKLREQQNNAKSSVIRGSVAKSGKYEIFKDENATLVLDVIEERQRIQDLEDEEEEYDEFAGLNIERGVSGVIDIEDLVEVLNRENAQDMFVVKLPSHLQYVDYIVVVTGKSLKHMLGLAEFVKKFYKVKRHKNDRVPKVEGIDSKDWLAIDLGNIALHIMTKTARHIYDLESLWAVGKEFDEKSYNDVDPLVEILKKHAINLDDFQPADNLR